MKKDIKIPKVTDVHIVLLHEYNPDFEAKEWNAYILNNKNTPIELVFVVSKGYDGDIKTATIRHSMEGLSAKSFEKLEFVQDDVLKLNNEFFLTFYAEDTLFEKRFIFEKESVQESNMTILPLLNKKGILPSN